MTMNYREDRLTGRDVQGDLGCISGPRRTLSPLMWRG